jgi:hypothetical protein
VRINHKLALWLLGVAMTAALSSAGIALATLGEAGDSVAVDRKALSAVNRGTVNRSQYTVQEIQSGSVMVREYVSSSNIVFGVAWNGRVQPDLDQLLGSYAGEYRDTLRKSKRMPGRRAGRQVKTGRIVVETWGQMRNLQGRAYVSALVPEGVSIDEIR